jgi:hypothetical protein
MNYADVRSEIKDGDLVFLRRKTGLFPKLITLVSGYPETHVCNAMWVDDRLMAAGMSVTNCLVPLSHYVGVDFDVYECPADNKMARAAILSMLDNEIKYAFSDLVTIAIRKLLSLDLGHSKSRMVCVAWSVNTLCEAMWHSSRFGTMRPDSTPHDLAVRIGYQPKFEVRNAV